MFIRVCMYLILVVGVMLCLRLKMWLWVLCIDLRRWVVLWVMILGVVCMRMGFRLFWMVMLLGRL